MDGNDHTSVFAEQMKRIHRAAGLGTQSELAEYFGVPQASVSDARRQGAIPAEWLVILMRSRNIDPEWILTGRGRQFLERPMNGYDDEDTAAVKAEALEVLRRLPSRLLAEELLRRMAVAEALAFQKGGRGRPTWEMRTGPGSG